MTVELFKIMIFGRAFYFFTLGRSNFYRKSRKEKTSTSTSKTTTPTFTNQYQPHDNTFYQKIKKNIQPIPTPTTLITL